MNQTPSHELLAAYIDGEFEGRDDLVALRRQIEAWLVLHPEAQAELAEMKRLRHTWQNTTPAEPGEAAWNKILARLSETPRTTRKSRVIASRRSRAVLVVAFAASISLVLMMRATWWGTLSRSDSDLPSAIEPFQVAGANEVEILRIDGDDVATLVVGLPPVKGPLELARSGEVVFTSVPPDMVQTVVADNSGTPMVYPSGIEDVKP